MRTLLLLCWCFTALRNFWSHFGRCQLTYPHCFWASLLGSSPILGAHSFASNWQLPFLNHRKGENGRRNYFMTNLHERMLPEVRIEHATVRHIRPSYRAQLFSATINIFIKGLKNSMIHFCVIWKKILLKQSMKPRKLFASALPVLWCDAGNVPRGQRERLQVRSAKWNLWQRHSEYRWY